MTEQEIIQQLNTFRPKFLDLMRCEILGVDLQEKSCKMSFVLDDQFSHSGGIIQGGFVAAMLDAVTSHAAFAAESDVVGVSSLELKVSYLSACREGKLMTEGRVLKLGRNIAFFSGEVYGNDGELAATFTSTAKVTRKSNA
ncbi:hypothetical protein R50073_31070 [Maricurvus nonylphenolicus]|uniref:PaaI family thioesterase n=1 Tax=Maricurvus nonylphenolicus TaxID=1008307 RepID=UPI0036F425A1